MTGAFAAGLLSHAPFTGGLALLFGGTSAFLRRIFPCKSMIYKEFHPLRQGAQRFVAMKIGTNLFSCASSMGALLRVKVLP